MIYKFKIRVLGTITAAFEAIKNVMILEVMHTKMKTLH